MQRGKRSVAAWKLNFAVGNICLFVRHCWLVELYYRVLEHTRIQLHTQGNPWGTQAKLWKLCESLLEGKFLYPSFFFFLSHFPAWKVHTFRRLPWFHEDSNTFFHLQQAASFDDDKILYSRVYQQSAKSLNGNGRGQNLETWKIGVFLLSSKILTRVHQTHCEVFSCWFSISFWMKPKSHSHLNKTMYGNGVAKGGQTMNG